MKHAPRPAPLLVILLTATLLVGMPARAATAEASPSAGVERLHNALIEVMKQAASLGFKGRYEQLSTPISEIHDLAAMAQNAVGTAWQKASPEQRQRLVEAFRRVSVGTYASRFDGYSGQSFKTVEERQGPGTTRIVATQLLRPPQSPVNLAYVVRKSPDSQWRVVEVLWENISELARLRSEYYRIIQDQGIDGLIAALERKASEVQGG